MSEQNTGSKPAAEVTQTPGSPTGSLQGTLASFSMNQRRALGVMTVIALGFAVYFLRSYLMLIALAAVLAFLFTPLYRRFGRKVSSGASAAFTLLSAIAIVIIPLGGILAIAGVQIAQMVSSVSTWVKKTDMSALGQQVLDAINDALGKIPFIHVDLTAEKIQSAIGTVASHFGEWALNLASHSVGGLVSAITGSIIFLYVFVGLLTAGPKLIGMIRDLSPLDPQITTLYFSKIGAMVKASVGGQFVIAAAQGLAASTSIYIGGIHQGFFMFLIFLTVLSVIPLGAGVVTIPLGIGMALSGNIPGGIFVVLFHLIITTNIDNILRPILVPKTAYLPPALMLLAVFAGLGMFGFAGIIFGPVVMIVVVTTINLYRAEVKGTPWEDDIGDDGSAPEKKNLFQKLKARLSRKHGDVKKDASDSEVNGAAAKSS